jgi:Tfp pilus assembly protein PilX
MLNSKKHVSSQAGIASLMVTMVLMIVISLIVLGFAQVARREQRNTLDRQLSTQAFYAAESGINDAQDAIDAAIQSNTAITSKTGCKDNPSGSIYDNRAHPIGYDVNSAQGVKYTCLLVSTQVPQLTKQLGLDGEWVIPVYPVQADGSPARVNNLRFTWPPEVAGNTDVSGCQGINNPTLIGYSNKCDYGTLRIDLVPVPASGPGSNPSRASLAASDMVLFAYPSNNGGSFAYSTGKSGGSSHQATARCNSSNCSMDVTGLNAGVGATYYARVHMLYKGTGSGSVAIDAGGVGSPIAFSGAQAQIDSTGKAQDVLRRLRVTINLNSTYQYSPYAVMTRDSICKRYAITDGVAPDYQVPSSEADPASNPMCATSSSGP